MTAQAEKIDYRWQGHAGPLMAHKDGVDIIACDLCGFAHILPLPDPEELTRFYREEFYDSERPQYITVAGEDEAWLRLTYADRFQIFEAHLPPDRRTVLDIGSGPGFFLLEAKSRGWHGTGVEPSLSAAEHAVGLGLTVINDFYTALLVEKLGRCDVVHMGEVLEHIPNPAEILTLAYQQLVPGGLICLSVPNDFNDLQDALIQHYEFEPWWVVPKHHLNYFSFELLENLVISCGFELVSRDTTFPMELFLLMGQNYVGDKTQGRKLHQLRKTFDQGLSQHMGNSTRRRFYQALAAAGFGRTAIITARRP